MRNAEAGRETNSDSAVAAKGALTARLHGLACATHRRQFPAVALLILVLVAFALRLYRLESQSLWHDEALSVISADPNLLTVINRIADVQHPPLHFWLLGLWISLVGQSEFAVRFLSVAAGTAVIPIVFAIGLRLGWRGSLVAAGLAAISPFLVYYGQETRGYALLALTGAISAYGCLRLLDRPSALNLAAYVIATLAVIYTHYAGLAMVAFEDLFFLSAFARFRPADGGVGHRLEEKVPARPNGGRADTEVGSPSVGADRSSPLGYVSRKKVAAFWMVGQALIALSFLPWALINIRLLQNHASSSWQSFSTASFFWQTAITFPLGHSIERYNATIDDIGYLADHRLAIFLSLAFLALVALGALSTVFAKRPLGVGSTHLASGDLGRRWFAVLWLLAPVIAVYLLSLDKRDFTARYLIASTPAYYFLVVAGILYLRRVAKVLGIAALVGVVGISSFALASYYGDAKYARDDYRSAAAFVQGHAQSNEAIILNAAYSYPAFDYYYRGAAPRYGLPKERPLDSSNTASSLRELGSKYDYLWLVLWQDYFSDPERFVETSLDRDYIRTREQTFHGNIKVRGYSTRSSIVSEPIDGMVRVGTRLGDDVELVGYRTEGARAGEETSLTLYWRALRTLPADNTVFLHLLDKSGALVVQADGPPVFGRVPTSKWPVGAVIEDEHRVSLAAYTAPGEYSLAVGLYDPATMRRVGKGQVDRAVVPLRVDRDRVRAAIPNARDVTLGNAVRLAGFDVPSAAKAGTGASVDLFWQAATPVTKDLKVFVHVLDSSGQRRAQNDARPANGAYAMSQWSQEEIVRDHHSLLLPPDLPAGEYALSVGVYDAESGKRLTYRPWPWARQESSITLAKMAVTR